MALIIFILWRRRSDEFEDIFESHEAEADSYLVPDTGGFAFGGEEEIVDQ
jgi:hypothetical protein